MPGFDYTGRYAYHLIAVTAGRQPRLVGQLAEATVGDLAAAAIRSQFEILAFVVMPDHVHILALGLADDASAIRLMQRFKQSSGYRFKQRHGHELWQWSFFDRVLRNDEDVLPVARYILGNPVEEGLIVPDERWPYMGGTLWAGDPADPADRHADDAGETRDRANTGHGAKAPSLRPLVAGETRHRAITGHGAKAPSLRPRRPRRPRRPLEGLQEPPP